MIGQMDALRHSRTDAGPWPRQLGQDGARPGMVEREARPAGRGGGPHRARRARELSLEMAAPHRGARGSVSGGHLRRPGATDPRVRSSLCHRLRARAADRAAPAETPPWRLSTPPLRLPGTGLALATLFQQLGESGRTPDEVDRVLARWADSTPASLLWPATSAVCFWPTWRRAPALA